jgi:hypothetical protein
MRHTARRPHGRAHRPSFSQAERELALGQASGDGPRVLWREPKLFCASFVFSAPHDPVDSTLRQIDCVCLGLARLRVAHVGNKNSLQGNGWEFLVEGAPTFSRLVRFLSTTRPCRLNPSADRSHMLGVGSPPSCTRGEQKLAAGERMGVPRSAELWREPQLFLASFVSSAPHDPVDSPLRQIDGICLGLARLRVAHVGNKNSMQEIGWEFHASDRSDLGATYAGTGTTPRPSLFPLNTQLGDPTGGFTTEFSARQS